MISKEKLAEICKYGNRIRNKAKRDYFWRYLAYLKYLDNGGQGLPPDRGNISCMAAQAVRMNIDDIIPQEIST